MGQLRHLLKACLIIITILTSYAFFKPFITSPIIAATQEDKIGYCGTSMPSSDVSNKVGKNLFQQNCQTCHALDKNLTGPALRGFTERGPWHKKENIYKWIQNPAAFMAKDKYTQGLNTQYGVIMQSFPQLSNDQIDSIVSYITEGPVLSY